MAYANSTGNPDDEEEDAPASTGGAPPAPAGSAGGGSGGHAPSAGASPSRFVAFDQYFNANKGAAEKQGTAAANEAFKPVSDQYDAADKDLTAGFDKFRESVDYNASRAGPQTTSRVRDSYVVTHPGQTFEEGGQILDENNVGDRAHHGNTLVHDDDGLGGFDPVTTPRAGFEQNVHEGSYAGPQAFDDKFANLSTLRSRFGDVAKKADAQHLDDSTFQDGFARQNHANAAYGQGAGAFDSALGARGGAGAFAGLRARFSKAGSAVDNKVTEGSERVQAAQNQVRQGNYAAAAQARDWNEAARKKEEEEGY